MEYKYETGLELLLAHMNVEDIINAAETLYQLQEEEEEEDRGLSFDEESFSQEEMDENEEAGEMVGLGDEQKDNANGVRCVRYGTVMDLLSFVNLLSNMQATALQHLHQEMGVVLNKVRVCCPCPLTLLGKMKCWCKRVFYVLSCFFAERHGCQERPLSDQPGRTSLFVEVNLQESWL